MSDIQLLTIVLTLLAILGSMYANRKSVEDMRDVLRAEANAGSAGIRGELHKSAEDIRGELHKSAENIRGELHKSVENIRGELQRIENKIDHLLEVCAGHGDRLDRLEKRKD